MVTTVSGFDPASTTSPGFEAPVYALTDRNFSVIGLRTQADDDAAHTLRYTPYGVGESQLRLDVTGDGVVNINDTVAVLGIFGSVAGDVDYEAEADFNGDGSVNIND